MRPGGREGLEGSKGSKGSEGFGGALRAQYKENLYNRAFARGKQANRPAGEGKAPFGGWRHHLSPSEAGGTMGAQQCAT